MQISWADYGPTISILSDSQISSVGLLLDT